MGIFNFFKKRSGNIDEKDAEKKSDQIGKDFDFLIKGDIDVFYDWDNIMTPNSFLWTKVSENNWDYYYVDEDKFYYSIEPPGIQMAFNGKITYIKAKAIADEIISNILATGQRAELIELRTDTVINSK